MLPRTPSPHAPGSGLVDYDLGLLPAMADLRMTSGPALWRRPAQHPLDATPPGPINSSSTVDTQSMDGWTHWDAERITALDALAGYRNFPSAFMMVSGSG